MDVYLSFLFPKSSPQVKLSSLYKPTCCSIFHLLWILQIFYSNIPLHFSYYSSSQPSRLLLVCKPSLAEKKVGQGSRKVNFWRWIILFPSYPIPRLTAQLCGWLLVVASPQSLPLFLGDKADRWGVSSSVWPSIAPHTSHPNLKWVPQYLETHFVWNSEWMKLSGRISEEFPLRQHTVTRLSLLRPEIARITKEQNIHSTKTG